MDCLYAACTPIITDCVMAELEKLGPKYRLALQIARDERFERSACDHKGTYADDCIVDRIMKHRIYIVATNDKDLCKFTLSIMHGASLWRTRHADRITRPENQKSPWRPDHEGRTGQVSH